MCELLHVVLHGLSASGQVLVWGAVATTRVYCGRANILITIQKICEDNKRTAGNEMQEWNKALSTTPFNHHV